ncbi:hypothetical protein FOA52_010845 [Chlamydomonas sp. UWO 241]|nr:hypothetical protein FOA52_010845 [Chlamydomonas sp. UWO 241]
MQSMRVQSCIVDSRAVHRALHGFTTRGGYPSRVTRLAAIMEPQTRTVEVTRREDVMKLYRQMETKAKAMIALDEMQVSTRPKVRITVRGKLGLGECWKVVGSCPELGRMQPVVAPQMSWSEGDVWVFECAIRPGSHLFKVVLRNHDGVYVWEEGPDRELTLAPELGPDSTLALEINPKMPW